MPVLILMPTQFMSMSSKALNRFHDFHLVLGDAKQQQSRRPIHIGIMVYLANECCPGEQHCGRNVILNCSIYRLALVQTYKVAPFLCSKEVCRIFQTHVMTSHTPQPDQNHRDQNHDAAFYIMRVRDGRGYTTRFYRGNWLLLF